MYAKSDDGYAENLQRNMRILKCILWYSCADSIVSLSYTAIVNLLQYVASEK